MHRSLVVFDLDGTLVDSLRDLTDSANELVVSLGGRPLDSGLVASMVGDGAGLLVRRALAAAAIEADPRAALRAFLDIYDRRLLSHTTAYPGMREALALASRRARFSVLTNKPEGPALRLLDRLRLSEFFDDVIAGDRDYPKKPDPAGLSALMSRAPGLPALFVGDSPVDAETAGAAGCAFAFARYGFGAIRFGEVLPATSFVLEQPSDLAGILDRFEHLTSGE
jgi:phosphoglycolate phosphatase